jgi:hypothetical protein
MYGKLAVKTAKPWQNLVPNCEDVAVERVESIVMLDYRVSRPPRGILKNGPGKPTQPTADQKLNRVHNVVFFLNFVTPCFSHKATDVAEIANFRFFCRKAC